MKYFNREGVEISEVQWMAHMRDPKYGAVRRHFYGSTDVVSSWLGMQSPYCPRPILWCTFVRKAEYDSKPIRASYWFTDEVTLEQVNAFHMSIVMEVGIPLGKKAKHVKG